MTVLCSSTQQWQQKGWLDSVSSLKWMRERQMEVKLTIIEWDFGLCVGINQAYSTQSKHSRERDLSWGAMTWTLPPDVYKAEKRTHGSRSTGFNLLCRLVVWSVHESPLVTSTTWAQIFEKMNTISSLPTSSPVYWAKTLAPCKQLAFLRAVCKWGEENRRS